ncbi:nuclear transport factor 2 family protein [Tessaracoccus flavus]|uniref:DUF4440 domain-containing protein n=1 Tax=Tessaracoccus flavus TaxID=1610493 RepID=A0A1Q2CBJ2_9ACTN|nr:nuclear transport factor 2 family protein [Tessaracoccus flavus]AQP43415.1 DUF4440 domain-containing protein [Tessaracoccus flavus]SDZ05166.1 hypothetical protein SAMN05428934_10930 [Tessaracoccus flavus]
MATLDINHLLSTEHNGWLALSEGTGASFYDALLTDDAVMVLVGGGILSRDEAVASLENSPTWDKYEITDPRLIEVGPDAAALVYRASALRGTEDTFRAAMTSLYRVVDGRLRLAIYQQTLITH